MKVFNALFERLLDAAWLMGIAAGVALVVIALTGLLERRLGRTGRTVGWSTLLIAGAGLAVWQAWQRLWLCDDAFITFRYARNLAEGHGLVFNIGEWVEGYTNFLWTALLGGLGWLGVDIPLAGLFGNLAAMVLLLCGVALTVRRAVSEGEGGRVPLVPFAALALAGSIGFCTWGSSGLETMPAALLVVGGIYATTRGRPTLAGLSFVLAAMTRPDHLLLWGCMGLALAGEDLLHAREDEGGRGWLWRLLGRLDWGRYLRFTAPLLLVYVPYFLIRWSVYGDLFPNTYYAKSGGSSYYRQGWIYLGVWLTGNGGWLWLSTLLLVLFGRSRGRSELRLRLFAALAVLIFGHYVVRVGGDFMQDRFFVVLWPIVAIALETSLRRRWPDASRGARVAWLAVAAASVAAAVTPVQAVPEYKKQWHIAAEYSFYRVKSIAPLKIRSHYFDHGQRLAELFPDPATAPRIGIPCVGFMGYYSRMPIVDAYGLTNRRVAHRTIKRRGRPGHEKRASRADMLAEGAELTTTNFWGKRWVRHIRFRAGSGLNLHLMRENPELRARLAGMKGVRKATAIDDLFSRAYTATRSRALESWRFLRAYAGHSMPDAVDRLTRHLGVLVALDDALPDDAHVEGDPVTVTKGTLRLSGPGRRTIRLPLEVGKADEVRLELTGQAGGAHRVELRAGAQLIATAAGDGEASRTVSLPVPRDAARPVSLVIIDDAAGETPMVIRDVRVPGPRDPLRRLKRVKSADALIRLLPAVEREAPLDSPAIAAKVRALLTARFTFEDAAWPAGAEVSGTAFGDGPVTGPVEDQQRIQNPQGRWFANSYHGKDRAIGRVALPAFTVPSRPIRVRVAGGKDCQKTFVGLEVDGEIVARVCGRRDEQLRARRLPAPAPAIGQPGRIVIVDEAKGPWGHIIADDIIVPRPDGPVKPSPTPRRQGPKGLAPTPRPMGPAKAAPIQLPQGRTPLPRGLRPARPAPKPDPR